MIKNFEVLRGKMSPESRARAEAMTKAMSSTTPYDVAEHLHTPEEMAAYLDACTEESGGDAAFIAKALDDIARAKEMTKVAEKSSKKSD